MGNPYHFEESKLVIFFLLFEDKPTRLIKTFIDL